MASILEYFSEYSRIVIVHMGEVPVNLVSVPCHARTYSHSLDQTHSVARTRTLSLSLSLLLSLSLSLCHLRSLILTRAHARFISPAFFRTHAPSPHTCACENM